MGKTRVNQKRFFEGSEDRGHETEGRKVIGERKLIESFFVFYFLALLYWLELEQC